MGKLLKRIGEYEMTNKEYKQVIDTINKNMVVLPDYMTNLPRVVLTQLGLSKVKEELKELIKE